MKPNIETIKLKTLEIVENSRAAIANIEGMSASASEIDNSVMLFTLVDNYKQESDVDDTLSIQRAMNVSTRGIKFSNKIYEISEELVSTGIYLKLEGTKVATSTAYYSSTTLKWIGAVGATMFKAKAGDHGFNCSNISFDCNNIANIGLHIEANTGESLQFPVLNNLTFEGYLKAGVVLGADNTTSLENGQLQHCTLSNVLWKGAGSNTNIDTYGVILNAQNCEFLIMDNVYFDPFTSIGGGLYVNHQHHILAVSGGLSITNMTGTRSTSYAIQVVVECGLNIDGYRAEDEFLVSYPSTSGLPSSPINIKNIQHRSGLATGLEDVIEIKHSGTVPTEISNSIITGNISLGTNIKKIIKLSNIDYRQGLSGKGSTIMLLPNVSEVSLEESNGIIKKYNEEASEKWYDADGSNKLLYHNSKGSLAKIYGISGSGTASKNLGGVITVSNDSNLATFTFPIPEADINYRIIATPLVTNGTPISGSNRVLSIDRTTTSFTLKVENAPSSGSSVVFSWFLFRA